MSSNKTNLPAIVKELGIASKVDNLNTLLNQKPPKKWLKVHKGVSYQPIDRVKNNLITIFQDYDWSIKDIRVVANSILVYGTLTVINPVTGRDRKVDGVGAWPIQLAKGSKPMQIENIIQDAIQKNAPAAESLALKSAAKKLGRIFSDGQTEVEFAPIYSTAPEMSKEEERLSKLIDAATTLEELDDLAEHITESLHEKFQTKYETIQN